MTETASLTVPLEDILSCFEGIIPSTICTVGEDGMPNITYLSVVHRIGPRHIALSRQFFKKTDENTLVNPRAQLGVWEPDTWRRFKLDVVYDRTETEGPLFERMRTSLDAVAAFEGMENVFKLKGVDICRVVECTMVPCDFPDGKARPVIRLEQVEEIARRITGAADLDDLFHAVLNGAAELLDYRHGFIMLVDESGERLYTVASTGFASSGAGSEVRIGDGLVGVAAERRQSIRLTHFTLDRMYSQAVREADAPAAASAMERAIPVPALASLESQLITPMLAHRKLVGMLCFQSEVVGRFQAADECAVAIVASQLAMAMSGFESPVAPAPPAAPAAEERAVQVKHYTEDDSLFLDNEYLIKGVAGSILWRLLNQYQQEARVDFNNKEIRLDQTLDLPDIKDNLEARLILLRKRLEDRCDFIRIEKTARGRFRLAVTRPLVLVQVAGGGPV